LPHDVALLVGNGDAVPVKPGHRVNGRLGITDGELAHAANLKELT
jgi:hypothetical protein